MVKLGRPLLLLALAVAVLSVIGCASRSALNKAQEELAAATQRVGTLEEQLKASQVALTTAQGDLARAQKDIATLASDATTLKGTLTATQSDVAAAKRELSSVGSDLSVLENSFSLTRNDVATVKADLTKVQTDVTKLNTTDPAERRVGLAILASIEYGVALQTWTATAYETVAGKVTDRVKAIDDSTLTSTWNAVGAARQSVLATTASTPERDAAFGVFRVAIDNFQLRLLQLITG